MRKEEYSKKRERNKTVQRMLIQIRDPTRQPKSDRPWTADNHYNLREAGELKESDEHAAQRAMVSVMARYPQGTRGQSRELLDWQRARWRRERAQETGEILETVIWGIERVEWELFELVCKCLKKVTMKGSFERRTLQHGSRMMRERVVRGGTWVDWVDEVEAWEECHDENPHLVLGYHYRRLSEQAKHVEQAYVLDVNSVYQRVSRAESVSSKRGTSTHSECKQD